MNTLEDITACIAADIAANKELLELTKFLGKCRVCDKKFQYTVRDVKNGKKRGVCSDKCATSNIKPSGSIMSSFNDILESVHKLGDCFDTHRDLANETTELVDPCPDSGLEIK